MLIGFQNGQTSVILRVKIFDSSATSPTLAGKAGLTNSSAGLVISTIADNESSATAYTSAASHIQTVTTLGTFSAPSASNCRFKEVDSTNHPGVYELQIADARFGASGAKSLLITLSGVTNMAQCDVVVPLVSTNPYDAVHGGMSAIPNTACTTNSSLLTSGTGTDQLSVTSGLVNVGKINSVSASSVTAVNANVGTAQPVNFTGTSGAALVKSDLVDVGGSAVSTSSAQLGVNVVTYNGHSAGTDANGFPNVNISEIGGVNNLTANPLIGVNVVNIAGQAAALDSNNLLKVDVEDIKGTTSAGAAGYVGPDWGHINAPTTTVDLSNTTIKNLDGNTVQTGDAYARLGSPAGASVSADVASIKTDTGTTIPGRLPTALTGGGNIKADAVAIGGDTACPAHLVALGLSYVIGSVNDSSPTTGGFVGSSGLSTTVGDYNRAFLVFTSGANQGLGRAISGYTGSTTKTFSFTGGSGSSDAPFPVAPANSDSFLIIGRAANGT